jgi:hypothetical protein
MAAAVDDPEVLRRKQECKELIRKEGGWGVALQVPLGMPVAA